jgi:hypothetical protein
MTNFASRPPSDQENMSGTFFRGGMMPAAPARSTHLIIFDLRSLNLHVDEGRKIEAALRSTLEKELQSRGIKNRSVIDLGNAVHGIAVD